VRIVPGFQAFAEGSALIELGQTKVICAVSMENRVPNFLRGERRGWVTAEYSMLPRSTITRTPREFQGRVGGRTHEIQRLIGRALRAVTDLEALGERTLTVDCDVLQADGGTRTAAITGSYVALVQAIDTLMQVGLLSKSPIKTAAAATSVAVVAGDQLLDPCYDEDFAADVDFNVVMTSQGDFVEIQGAAEVRPFSREISDALLSLAERGIEKLFAAQEAAIDSMRA